MASKEIRSRATKHTVRINDKKNVVFGRKAIAMITGFVSLIVVARILKIG